MPRKEILKISFPLYSLFSGAVYDFSTIRNAEMFLSYPLNFNDPFDGAILIDKNEFVNEYLIKLYGDNFVSVATSILGKSSFTDIFTLIEMYNLIRKENLCCMPEYLKEGDIFFGINAETVKKECFALYDAYIAEIKEVRNEYGVACFTANAPETNMAMWAYYANNYKGFCCKFEFDYYNVDTNFDTKGTSDLLKHFYKIKYTKKIPYLEARKLLSCPLNKVGKSKYIRNFVEKVLTLKNTQWKHENEYRLIIHKNSKLFPKTFHKNNKGFKIAFPYLQALYIDLEKCVDEDSIVDIANVHSVKYYNLSPSKNGICLVEDKSKLNEHNLILDVQKIPQTNLQHTAFEEDIPF